MINFNIYLKLFSVGGFLLLLSALPIFYTVYSQNDNNGKRVKPLLIIEDANRPSLDYDGTRVATGHETGVSQIYDVDTGKKIKTFTIKGSESTAVSPDGKLVRIFGSESHSLFDVEGENSLSNGSIYFFQGERRIGFGKVWNEGGFNTKNITSDLKLVAHRFFPENGVKPDPQSPAIILGNLENNLLIKEFRTEDQLDFYDQWNRISITPDGKLIAAYRHNIKNKERNTTVVWDVETGKIIFNLPFYALESFSENGKRIAVVKSNGDSQIEVWDVQKAKRISTLTETVRGEKIRVSRGLISPDGSLVVTTGNEEFYLWNAETGEFIAAQQQNEYSEGVIKSATFSGDGKRIAVGSNTEVVTVWLVSNILKGGN